MEKKQPLFLIIALVIFGMALASAMWAFSKKNVTAHRDELISEVTFIASDAFQYRHHPKAIGGGGGSYAGYHIPSALKSNGHAEFTVTDSADEELTIEATSVRGIGSVAAKVSRNGEIHNFSYTGEFLE
jgi:hypothetical protein